MSLNQDGKSPEEKADMGSKDVFSSIHLIGLSISLGEMSRNLKDLEANLNKKREPASKGGLILEALKIIFGGWPAFGFLFLILFYNPLSDALKAIPDKVKSAQEIGIMGVSLKSTIKEVAVNLGEEDLSKTIPKLSSNAIELLLKASKNPNSFVSYHLNDEQKIDVLYLPNAQMLVSLAELQSQGLVDVEIDDGKISKEISESEIKNLTKDVQKRFPGTLENSYGDGSAPLKLMQPLPKETPIRFMWKLTTLGETAVDVILKAISTELTPKK